MAVRLDHITLKRFVNTLGSVVMNPARGRNNHLRLDKPSRGEVRYAVKRYPTRFCLAAMASGNHPIPSRTRK